MIYTRRDFGKLALTALPAARLLAMPQAKPDSRFGGVQIGIIAPYSFRGLPSGADDLLKYLVQLGVNSVELQSEPVETYAGAPATGRGGFPGGQDRPQGAAGGAPGGQGAAPPGAGRPPMTPEQQAAQRARAEELRKWRLSAPMEKYKELRKKYDDSGVTIHIVKFGLNANMPAEEIDYCFNVAKALGCKAITCEPPLSQTKQLGEFAAKHQIAPRRVGAMTFPKDSKSPERRFGVVSPGAERAGKLAVEPLVDQQRADWRIRLHDIIVKCDQGRNYFTTYKKSF